MKKPSNGASNLRLHDSVDGAGGNAVNGGGEQFITAERALKSVVVPSVVAFRHNLWLVIFVLPS